MPVIKTKLVCYESILYACNETAVLKKTSISHSPIEQHDFLIKIIIELSHVGFDWSEKICKRMRNNNFKKECIKTTVKLYEDLFS